MSSPDYQEPWTPPTNPAAPTTPIAPTPAAADSIPTTPMMSPTDATAPLSPQLAPTLLSPIAANQPTINLAAPAPGELLRFGPGVPVPAPAPDMTQAAAIWRGEAQPTDDPPRRRRRLITWLLPLLVLIAVLAILLWQHSGTPLTVTDAAVHAASPALTCDGTANVNATMHTNGASGTITYRWRRSDGTVSDTLRQQVTKGSSNVHVVLLWSFHGQGAMNATATLEVLSPSQISASTTFTYTCP